MTGSVSPDMRDLLIRLDQRVSDGFQNITAKLDRIETRADGHEQRIQSLEQMRAQRDVDKDSYTTWRREVDVAIDNHQTALDTANGGFQMGKLVWPAVAALVGFVGSQVVDLKVVQDNPKASATASQMQNGGSSHLPRSPSQL